MLRYAIRRIFFILPLVLIVLTVVFVIIRIAPGDPAISMLGDSASKEALDALREKMGLNAPVWIQYFRFLANLARGDLGTSMLNGLPVADQLLVALPYTLELTLSGMAIGMSLGIPLGVICAIRRNRLADYLGRVTSLAGVSIPSFYLGILLLFVFSVQLGLFPVTGGSADNDIVGRLYHLCLPAFTLGLIMTSYFMRFTRSAMLNVLDAEFVRTARGKGLPEISVIYKHALLNALVPIVSIMGLFFIVNLGGSIMVEIVFSRAGLGKMMVLAMKQRDYAMLQSVMIVYATIAILINLAVDLIYGLIDPRIKYR